MRECAGSTNLSSYLQDSGFYSLKSKERSIKLGPDVGHFRHLKEPRSPVNVQNMVVLTIAIIKDSDFCLSDCCFNLTPFFLLVFGACCSQNPFHIHVSIYCNRLGGKTVAHSLGTVVGSNSACVKHIYCSGSDIDLTLPGIIDVFDPIELSSLPEETKQRILSSYSGFDPRQIVHISSLLIPNSESLTKRALSFCGKYYCDPIAPYTLLVDLLQIPSDRIMIKPHPHGSFSFDERFENTVILDKTFPIEFLQLLPECRIEQMLSVETSAVDKVNNLVKHSIVASRFFMIRLDEMISSYTAVQLPLMLPHKKCVFFSHTAMEIKELIRIFAESVGVPRDRQLIVTNQLINIDPHSITIVHSEEDAVQFGSRMIHKIMWLFR